MNSSQSTDACGYGQGIASGPKSTSRGTKLHTSAPRAWRIIGAASCFAGDAAGATAALDALDDKGRRFVAYVCANNKVALPAR